MNVIDFTIPMLYAEYAFLYHKAQLATWEEDDYASSDDAWMGW